MSINITRKELENEGFITEVSKLCNNSKLSDHSICIEISETVGIPQLDKAKENVMKLKQLQIIIALDDFGVEYSTFQPLNH